MMFLKKLLGINPTAFFLARIFQYVFMERFRLNVSLLSLFKIINDREFVIGARKLEKEIISYSDPYTAYRLAVDVASRGFSTHKLETCIIQSGNSKLIYKFAINVHGARVDRLQKAIITLGSTLWIARFGCHVRGADKSLIEKLVIKSGDPRAAYLFIKNVRYCNNISKLKKIIIKSGKPRYLFALAKVLSSKKDIKLLQDMIINSDSTLYVRMFAEHIKGADIAKLEHRVLQTRDPEEIKKFADRMQTDKALKLALLC